MFGGLAIKNHSKRHERAQKAKRIPDTVSFALFVIKGAVRRDHLALELRESVVELKMQTSGIARRHTPACMC
jgi:hypothetical protein